MTTTQKYVQYRIFHPGVIQYEALAVSKAKTTRQASGIAGRGEGGVSLRQAVAKDAQKPYRFVTSTAAVRCTWYLLYLLHLRHRAYRYASTTVLSIAVLCLLYLLHLPYLLHLTTAVSSVSSVLYLRYLLHLLLYLLHLPTVPAASTAV